MFDIGTKVKGQAIIKFIIGLVAGALFLGYTIQLFHIIPMDSDYSNLILEANDIVHGNIFLNEWSQTGISFLTTDLLYYMLAILVKGVSKQAYWIASGLMVSCMFFSAIPLFKIGRRGKFQLTEWMIFLAVGAFPTVFGINVLRAHTGVYVWIFIAIACFCKMYRGSKKVVMYSILFAVSVILGCIGDAIIYIVLLIPVVLYCLRDLLSNRSGKRKPAYLLLLTVGSVILANVIEKIYYFLGDANKNSFLETKIFEELSNYPNKIGTYVQVILGLNHADFTSQLVVSSNTFFFFVYVLIVVFSFIIMGIHICDFVRGKRGDTISQLLSMGFLLVSLILIITNVAIDILCARYIGACPVIFAVLMVRFIRRKRLLQLRFASNHIPCVIAAFLLAAVLIVHNFIPFNELQTGAYEQDSIVDELKKNGLTCGYANFWDASLITVLSSGRNEVRPISVDAEMKSFPWGSKRSWFEKEAEFVLVRDPEWVNYGVTYNNVISQIGEPARLIEAGNYKILIYDFDISEKIVIQ